MKKPVLLIALAAVLFSMNVSAQEQEPIQKKKEKTEKGCSTNGKKCCAGEEKRGCSSEATEEKPSRRNKKRTGNRS